MSVIRHIVLLKFDTKKEKEICRWKQELYALQSKIPGIISLDISAQNNSIYEGYNARASGYTHILDMVLKDSESLKNYATHPEHVRVINEHTKPLLTGEDPLLAVDYEQVEVKTEGLVGAVRHFVFFKVDPKKFKEFETKTIPQILSLQQSIPNVLTLRVGIHNPSIYSNYTDRSHGRNFILDSTYTSPAALKVYADHPEHKRVIKDYIQPNVIAPAIAIDWITGLQRKVIRSSRAPAPIAPYSQAIRVGNIVYVSGAIGMDLKGDLKSDIESQTVQTLENLKAVIEEAGGTLSDVVKATVLMKNITDGPKINEIYAKYFPTNPPARAAYAVAALPKNALVEIECIVALPIRSSL